METATTETDTAEPCATRKRRALSAGDEKAPRTAWREVPDGPQWRIASLAGHMPVSSTQEAAELCALLPSAQTSLALDRCRKRSAWTLDVGTKLVHALGCEEVGSERIDQLQVRRRQLSEQRRRLELQLQLLAEEEDDLARRMAKAEKKATREAVARALGGDAGLFRLDLSQHRMSDADGVALAMALERNQSLRELDLGGCLLHEEAIDALGQAMHVNSTLRVLRFGCRETFFDACGSVLAAALERNCKLQELGISRCGLEHFAVAALGQALRANTTLRRLSITDSLGSIDEGVVALAEALEHNRGLRHLDLRKCSLGSAAIDALAGALAVNGTLQELCLSGNILHDAGCATVAKALERNRGLRVLELEQCALGPGAARALARALCASRSLERLALSLNGGIGDAGAVAVAKALPRARCLRSLALRSCCLSRAAMEALSEAMEASVTLRELDLSRNLRIGEAGLLCLIRALERGATLRRLDLSDCWLGDKGTSLLRRLQAENPRLKVAF